jgi:DNA-binding response OmpR family regulator
MSRILVVEDESHLARGLQFNLEAEGHAVTIFDNGEDALKSLLTDKESFDAVVLDVMLPGKDGFTVTRELRRAENYTPVLMLTARSRPEDVLQGFEAGADDFVPKPFNLAVLLARIVSLLRRKRWLRAEAVATESAPAAVNGDAPAHDADSFTFGNKTIDFQNLQLHCAGKTFQLTLMETELLRYLVHNREKAVSRKSILENVWNLREDTDTRAIDNFIVRLRRYIEAEPTKPRHLLTVRGVGYQFMPEPKA